MHVCVCVCVWGGGGTVCVCVHVRVRARVHANVFFVCILFLCAHVKPSPPPHRFVLLPSGALQHVSSGMCVAPLRGHTHPADNTPLILSSECDAAHHHALRFEIMVSEDLQARYGPEPERIREGSITGEGGRRG